MDGIAAITSRVNEIRALIEPTAAPPATAAIGRTTATGAAREAGATLFGDLLSAALAERGTADLGGTAAPPGAAAEVLATTGARTADGVPTDLARYGNGKIPASALETIGGTGHRLWAPAAHGLEQLLAAASRDGVAIGITDSYRSYDAQVDVARRKGLYTEGGLAAVPGTSQHGWGLAVDLDLDAGAQAWMRANADRFGFVEDTPREPWHWVYSA